MLDVLILGAGPAGLALAHEANVCGLTAACMAPDPHAVWPQTLCAWMDELDTAPLKARWGSVEVRTPERRVFDRPYGLIDNAALQARLSQGVTLLTGRADRVEHGDDHSVVGPHRARLVVDATGHHPTLLSRPSTPPVGWQSAYGVELEGPHGLPLDRAVLMDFRGPAGLPTFLYALPLSEDRVFVEETSLIARNAPSFEFLRDRLEARLERMGIRGRVVDSERCLFPMGVPLPRPQRVIGFGAAAGMVHPATGYSVGRTLRAAKRVAAALDPSLPPSVGALLAWDAVWPASAKRARALHLLGARILDGLDRDRTQAFFADFFAMPESSWAVYMDPDRAPIEPMLRFFASTDRGVALSLVAAGMDSIRGAA